ncbi:MAG TPA: hypothetical protein VF859_05845 [Burkholderiales bacterium]
MAPRAAWLLVVGLLFAGCASVEKGKPAAPKPNEQPEAAVATEQPTHKPRERSARKSGPRAIATRPINVKADCSFKDPTGYRGTMKLQVAEAQVRQFEATVTVPEHGSCRFVLREFQQTEQMPNPVLKHRSNGCEVRLWEQGRRVTVAFVRCRDNCSSRGAFERLWPILADAANGSCG